MLKFWMKLWFLAAFLIIIHDGEAVLQNGHRNLRKGILIGAKNIVLWRDVLYFELYLFLWALPQYWYTTR